MRFLGFIIFSILALIPSASFASQAGADRSVASEPSEYDWVGWYNWLDQNKKDCGAGCIQRGARDVLTQDATFKIWRALELQEEVKTAGSDKDKIKSIVLREIPEYCVPADFQKSGDPANCFTRFEAVTVRQLRTIRTQILRSNENVADLRSRGVGIERSDAKEQSEKAAINPTILTAQDVQKSFYDEIGKSNEDLEKLATLHFEELAENFPKPPSRSDFYRYERRRVMEPGVQQGKLEDRYLKGCEKLEDSVGIVWRCVDERAYQEAVDKYKKDYAKAMREYRQYAKANPGSRSEAIKAYKDNDMDLESRLKSRRVNIQGAVGSTTYKAFERSGQIVLKRAQQSVRTIAPGVQSLEFSPQQREIAARPRDSRTESISIDDAAPSSDPRALGNRVGIGQPDLHVIISPATIDKKIKQIQK